MKTVYSKFTSDQNTESNFYLVEYEENKLPLPILEEVWYSKNECTLQYSIHSWYISIDFDFKVHLAIEDVAKAYLKMSPIHGEYWHTI